MGDCLTKSEKEDLDKELVMTFYHLGLPFSLVEAPTFVNLLHKLRSGHKPFEILFSKWTTR